MINHQSRKSTQSIIVRTARESDYPAVNRLFCEWQQYHHLLLPTIFKAQKVKTFIKRGTFISLLEDYDSTVIVVVIKKQRTPGQRAAAEQKVAPNQQEQQVVGLVEVMFDNVPATDDHYGSKQANIEYLYVIPEFRRQGVGRALIEAATAWAKKKKRDFLTVAIYDANAEGVNLYRQNKFQPLNTRFVRKL